MNRRRNARAARLAERAGGAGSGPTDAIWPGIPGGRYQPLGERDIESIYVTALEILAQVGLKGATPKCIETVSAAGGKLTDDGRLLMPQSLVESVLETAGRGFKLYAQDPHFDLDPGKTRVHLGTPGGTTDEISTKKPMLTDKKLF